MKQQKTSGVSKLVASLLGAALLGLATQNAMALTLAGATVSNTATLQYSVGNVAQNSIGSSPTGNNVANATPTTLGGGAPTSFVVDQKVDLLVTTNATATAVTPGQGVAVTAFLVTNTGNAAQGYNLVAANALGNPAAGGGAPFTLNNFNATGLVVHVSAAAGATLATPYNPATDTATTIPTLAPGASQVVYIVASVPLTAMNAQQSVVSLLATAAVPTTLAALTQATVNTAGMDIVFADGAGVVDAVRAANHSAYNAYLVKSAAISVTKAVAVLCDPVNGATGAMNIPGSAVQYAVTITNTGNGAATLATINDALAATLLFDPRLISGAGAVPATTCTSAGGASLSGTGFGVVNGAIPLTAVTPATFTTYAAPGLAAQAASAGGAVAGAAAPQTVTVDFATLAVGGAVTLTGGSLPGVTPGADLGQFVTVYFNAFVQ
ncbi:MAG: hypothetical protein PXX73_05960 [Sideroxydans sp.]|nr:hypothetical protein [Sideroxydans sp.]